MATAPSSTVARQTVSAGLKNSDFHDAGPTAQSKSSGLLEPVPARSLVVVPASRQIAASLRSPWTTAPSRATGPTVRYPRSASSAL